MSTKQTMIALGLGIALCAFSIPAVSQDSSRVVAEIAGRKVTADESQKVQERLGVGRRLLPAGDGPFVARQLAELSQATPRPPR